MAAEKKKGGLAGLLLLGKPKAVDEGDDEEAPPSSKDVGGIEDEYFSKAFDAIKADNQDAFARFLRKGIDACVEKAKAGDYEEG